MDLILGLEFLVKNKIVVDVELRMVVTKETRYDLLNPPDPKLLQKKVQTSLFQRWKQEAWSIRLGQKDAKKTQLLIYMELMALFEENPECFDFEEYMTGPPDIVTSIKV